MTKYIHILFTICAVLFLFAVLPAGAEIIDRVVAVVNDDVITMTDLENEGAPVFAEIRAKTPPSRTEEVLSGVREKIVESLIDKALITQNAKTLRIGATDEEIDAAQRKTLESNKISQEEFRARLKQAGRTEADYRDTLRYQIIQSKIINSHIRSKIVISDEDITHYYNTKILGRDIPEGYHLLQIGFVWDKVTPDDERATIRSLADKARKLALDGEDFIYLAHSFSQMPSAVDGGDIGYFTENEMSASMRNSITTIEPGGISSIIETAAGLQFFKLVSFRNGDIIKLPPLESMKKEIVETLTKNETEKRFEAWMKEIKEQAYIKKLL